MNIKEEASKLHKKIEKLRWELDSSKALSYVKRDKKNDKIKDWRKELEGLGKN